MLWLSLMCEATHTDAAWLLQFPFGSHVDSTVWSMAVAIVTDADLLSVGHLALALLRRTLQHICNKSSISGNNCFLTEMVNSDPQTAEIIFKKRISHKPVCDEAM